MLGIAEITREHEFENITKCLKAGFSRIAAVSTGRRMLEYIAADVQGALGPVAAAKVRFYTPDEFIDELEKLARESERPPAPQPMAAQETVDGIVVERIFPKQTLEEQKATQKVIHEIVQKNIKPLAGR